MQHWYWAWDAGDFDDFITDNWASCDCKGRIIKYMPTLWNPIIGVPTKQKHHSCNGSDMSFIYYSSTLSASYFAGPWSLPCHHILPVREVSYIMFMRRLLPSMMYIYFDFKLSPDILFFLTLIYQKILTRRSILGGPLVELKYAS